MSVTYSDIVVRNYDNFASFPTSLPTTNPFAFDKATGILYYWNGTSYKSLASVTHDTTLTGNGTSGSPLGVVDYISKTEAIAFSIALG